jgi:glycosyltransferase involved in cell wall biosynthesis
MPHLHSPLSVIIPHFNQPVELSSCLSALLTGPGGDSLDVIVVDNGSKIFPDAVAARFPAVRFLSEPTPGPGPARNTGVAAARSDWIAFIDADCVPNPDWAEVIRRDLAATTDILGGEVRIGLVDPAKPTIWEAYESQYGFRMDKYVRREGFSGAGNLALPRGIYDAVGGFAGIGVAEDRDWGLRALAKGFRTRYVGDMIVYHPARKSWAEIARKWDRQTAHQYTSYRSQRFGRAKWALRCAAMSLSPLVEFPKIAISSRIPGGLRGRVLCSAALVRTRLYRTRLMLDLLVNKNPEQLANRWRKS